MYEADQGPSTAHAQPVRNEKAMNNCCVKLLVDRARGRRDDAQVLSSTVQWFLPLKPSSKSCPNKTTPGATPGKASGVLRLLSLERGWLGRPKPLIWQVYFRVKRCLPN